MMAFRHSLDGTAVAPFTRRTLSCRWARRCSRGNRPKLASAKGWRTGGLAPPRSAFGDGPRGGVAVAIAGANIDDADRLADGHRAVAGRIEHRDLTAGEGLPVRRRRRSSPGDDRRAGIAVVVAVDIVVA